MNSSQSKNGWLLPGAILFSGLVLAFAVYSARHQPTSAPNGHPEAARPVSPQDHILGNPTAPIVVIEYSDIDSSYATDYQQVMTQIVQNYSKSGSVLWVFRNFPGASSDVNAGEHAEAAECVAAVGGSSGFFKFINAIQAAMPADGFFDPVNYDPIVTSLGYSSQTFESCLKAHTYQKQVQADNDNAVAVGATGSPYSIVLAKGQKPVVVAGSVPYGTMKQVIDSLLQKQLQTK